MNSSSIKLLKDYYIYIPEDAEVFTAKGRKVAIIYRRFKSTKYSRPKDEQTKNIIANMDAIDFQTLLAEQMNR